MFPQALAVQDQVQGVAPPPAPRATRAATAEALLRGDVRQTRGVRVTLSLRDSELGFDEGVL